MGYYAIIGGEHQVPLASLRGWSDFKAWAESLEAKGHDQIIHLCDHGFCQHIPELIKQLKSAKLDKTDGSVASTVQSLIVSLETAPGGAESVFVSDGTGPDDEGAE